MGAEVTHAVRKGPVVREALARSVVAAQVVDEVVGGRKLVVVLGAGGDNARRFSKGLSAQGLLIAGVGLDRVPHVGEIAVDPSLQFGVSDYADQERLHTLLDSGLVSSVYDSTTPQVRLDNYRNHILPHMRSGKLDRYITTKPIGTSLTEYLIFQNIIQDPANNPEGQARLEDRFFIHEHYLAKGPWVAIREHLGEATDSLGRLTRVSVSIQEGLTAEEQHREIAFAGGSFKDYGPHVASICLDLKKIINSRGRYEITNVTEQENLDTPLLATVRYQTDKLPPDVDTGFEARAKSTIIDSNGPKGHNEHELHYEWMAGKGLVDKKLVIMDFEHPDTHEKSRITVNFQNNTITAPASVQHLFQDAIIDDDGYGKRTAGGLNGTDPNLVYQRFPQALEVAAWETRLFRQNNWQLPVEYQIPVQGHRPRVEDLVDML